jgi:hypothetical protein
MGAAGWVEDHIQPAKALLDGFAAVFPADRQGAFKHEIRILDRPSVAAHPDARRQMDHLHAIAAGRCALFADIVEAGEAGLPDRPPLGMAHDMAGKFLVARVAAVGIEGGDRGDVLGVDRFGASAPGDVVMREYGFTAESVCKRALALLP